MENKRYYFGVDNIYHHKFLFAGICAVDSSRHEKFFKAKYFTLDGKFEWHTFSVISFTITAATLEEAMEYILEN
jgi:hypothetical protein